MEFQKQFSFVIVVRMKVGNGHIQDSGDPFDQWSVRHAFT
ncbi:hypothetical protein C7S13_2318 [Burkholderia cepacia]|nr:hypothetical protein [Burkholderia cepacia]